jgi:hypothetical protein
MPSRSIVCSSAGLRLNALRWAAILVLYQSEQDAWSSPRRITTRERLIMTQFAYKGRLYDITFASNIIHNGVSLELTEISDGNVIDIMLAFRSDNDHSILVQVFQQEIPLAVVTTFLTNANEHLYEALKIKQERVYPLQEIRIHADTLPWQLDLFIARDGSINGEMRAAIIHTEEYDEADEHTFAQKYGLRYAQTVSAVQAIVLNARQQRPACNPADLVNAFVYYYHNDAFIDLGSIA